MEEGGTAEGRGCRVIPQMGGGGGTAERGGGTGYFLRWVEEGELLRGEGVQGISSDGWRRGNC